MERQQVLNAFSAAGIDAAFDEGTPDRNLERKVSQLRALSAKKRRMIPEALREQQHSEMNTFLEAIEVALSRRVIQVGILTLFGRSVQCSDIASAIDVLAKCKTTPLKVPFVRFEVDVRFSNGDEIRASFQSIQDAIAFLRQFG